MMCGCINQEEKGIKAKIATTLGRTIPKSVKFKPKVVVERLSPYGGRNPPSCSTRKE